MLGYMRSLHGLGSSAQFEDLSAKGGAFTSNFGLYATVSPVKAVAQAGSASDYQSLADWERARAGRFITNPTPGEKSAASDVAAIQAQIDAAVRAQANADALAAAAQTAAQAATALAAQLKAQAEAEAAAKAQAELIAKSSTNMYLIGGAALLLVLLLK